MRTWILLLGNNTRVNIVTGVRLRNTTPVFIQNTYTSRRPHGGFRVCPLQKSNSRHAFICSTRFFCCSMSWVREVEVDAIVSTSSDFCEVASDTSTPTPPSSATIVAARAARRPSDGYGRPRPGQVRVRTHRPPSVQACRINANGDGRGWRRPYYGDGRVTGLQYIKRNYDTTH
jgi:hypothetical protein